MIFFRNSIVIALSCISISFASAQTLKTTIDLEPSSPLPYSPVTLTLDGKNFDVSTTFITWTVGGDIVLSGEGKTSLTLTTGTVGEIIPVSVETKDYTGKSTRTSIKINPFSITLLQEAPRSYVPAFYQGRSFAADGGTLRVTAFPFINNGKKTYSQSELSYTWYLNDLVQKEVSGKGRSAFNARLDFLKSENSLKVVIRTPEGAQFTKTTTLSPHPVLMLLYKYDELFGTLFTKPAYKRLESSSSFVLALEPFYLSVGESKGVSYKWLLDGVRVEPTQGTLLGLSAQENTYGKRNLTVEAYGPDKRIQSAETSLQIIFDTRQ